MELRTCNSILDAIGNTPLVRLHEVVKSIPAKVYAKVEGMNPGLSSKDRIALYMIEKAEKEGRLQPGGTIFEATSGNTGYGIAMVSAVKGYNCVLCTTKKTSQEKIQALEALGAQVVICPSVHAADPRSYYNTAERLHTETPNSIYLNQNFDCGNAEAHYYTTGPEIWQQTQGTITHYIACVGTGGTISGTGKYLKDQNPNVQVIGVDAYGSVLAKYHQTGEFDESEISPYQVEGLGKTIIPGNVYFDVIDNLIKVNDYNSAIAARRLAKEEGLFVGFSSGSALHALYEMKDELTENDVVVLLFSDHGSKYLNKIFNEEWLEENVFKKDREDVKVQTLNNQWIRKTA